MKPWRSASTRTKAAQLPTRAQWAGGTENGIGLVASCTTRSATSNAWGACRRSPRGALNWGDKNDFLQYYLGRPCHLCPRRTRRRREPPYPIVGVEWIGRRIQPSRRPRSRAPMTSIAGTTRNR